jgi:NADPH:quinone reductase-like Zn-dependent oxidoreductase
VKAVLQRRFGPPSLLELAEVARPVPADDEVLIRVHAASVNPMDWHLVRGTPYVARLSFGMRTPKVSRFGHDVAGTVEAVGRNVARIAPGDAVFGAGAGAFAEWASVPAGRLARKPPNVGFEDAASVPIAGTTALQALRDKAGVRSGQRVLVNGAAGGVGTFAVQIAKSFGADVTGVCSTGNLEMVRAIGADRVVDYTREDFTRSDRRWDAIVDCVGNHSLAACARVLDPAGTLVLVGGPDGRWIGPLTLLAKAPLMSRIARRRILMMLAKVNAEDLGTLADLLASGRIRPVIDRRYPLEQAADAVSHLERGHARGKVVVRVGS